MAQLQLLIELRCVQCDTVLVVNGIHTDKDGCFAYIEPCEECSKLTQRAADGAVCSVCETPVPASEILCLHCQD